MMQLILLLVVLVIIAAVFFSVGFVLRKRSRWLKIVVTTSIAVTVFLVIALIGSRIGIGVYDFYHYGVHSCQNQSPPCLAETREEQDFRANVPRLTLWMTVPKLFRPSCETISPEFCLLEKSFDMAPIKYLAGAFGAVIVVFLIGQGMRQRDEEVQLA